MKAYEKKTKTDLHMHPLATELQSCNSSSDILTVLLDKVNEFEKIRGHNERLSSWLSPTINVLNAFSSVVSQDFGLVSLNESTFPTDPPLISFPDILTCICHLYRYRYSMLGEDLPKSFFGGVFNTKVRQAAKDVCASEEALSDLFDRI